jgi:hypothetical protein
MRGEDDEMLVRSLDAGRGDLKDGILATRDLHELLGDRDRLETLRQARDNLGRDGADLSEPGRQALDTGREILRPRVFVARFAELRTAVEVVRADRGAAWEEARDQLQSVIAQVREQAAPLLDLLTEAQQAELTQRLEAVSIPADATLETGPAIETIRVRTAQFPALIDELRAAIGRNQGKTVRRVAARDIFSEPVRSEGDLEALLTRIREAAEEALKDDEYFLLT